MKAILLSVLLFLSSCTFPRIVQRNSKKLNTNFKFESNTIPKVADFHFSATLRRRSDFAPPYDSVDLGVCFEQMLMTTLQTYPLELSELNNSPNLRELYDLRIRLRRMPRHLKSVNIEGFKLVPIVNYYVYAGEERESGGFPGFSSPTGNDFYSINHEVYVALYAQNRLVYLNNAIRKDRKIVPSGTPITHEFPQEVLDTLMQMALEPLLRQLDRNK